MLHGNECRKVAASVALACVVVITACGDDGGGASSSGTDIAESGETPDETGETTKETGTDDATAGVSATTTGDAASGTCDETVPGTQINYGTYAPTPSLDPTAVSGGAFGGTEMAALYDTLMVENAETGEIAPRVAESLTPNDDFTRWTLELPDDLTFSNGDPFDAENVIAHVERFSREGVRHAAAGWFGVVESSQAVDDHTVVFDLKQPWSTFPVVFTREPGMVVNTRVVAVDEEGFGADAPAAAGIGPYVVERYAVGEELVLAAREDYWDGPVCIETIRFTSIAGARATYDSYRAGDLDIGHLQDPFVANLAREDGENFIGEQQPSGLVLQPNHRDGHPGADPRVREAMMLALNEEIINDRTYEGTATTSRSIVPPESRYYSDAIDEIPYDPDRAAELVEEAKADGFDGRIHAVGQSQPPLDELMLAVEGQLEAVGFEVELELLPTADFVTKLVEGDFDLSQSGWTGLFVMNLTTFLGSESPANRIGYKSEAMDTALDELLAAPDEEAFNAAVANVNNVLIDQSVTFPVSHPYAGIVVAPSIHGISQSAVTTYLFHDAYIEE